MTKIEFAVFIRKRLVEFVKKNELEGTGFEQLLTRFVKYMIDLI